ncbi:MAG: ABC transporter permease [Dehalococcoidia bacterium]|jgi:ABC-type dipeptide/oligopeptide/nickel transport system permease subunit
MAENIAQVETGFSENKGRVSEWKRFRRVFFARIAVIVSLAILILLFLVAIFAPLLAPYDPYLPDHTASLAQPSADHWLGTDKLGRDTLSRLIYGSRTALEVGFITVIVGSIIGIILGMVAGFTQGFWSAVIMRIMDAMMCFPMLIFALVLAALLGNGIQNVIIALSIASIPIYARVVNGLTMSLKQNDYILSQKSMGSGSWRTMMSHILPNAFPPLIVIVTMQLGGLILAEAGLSFLGIGIKPPGAAWGAMVNEGYPYLRNAPMLSFAPGLAIMLVVFAFNIVGDGLRDALDPKLRGMI